MARAVVAGAALAALAPASAAVGAPQDQGMAPGGWGPDGWQSGGASTPMPSAPGAPPMAQGYVPAPPMAPGYGPGPMMAPARPVPPMVVRRTDFRPLRPGERLHGRWLDPSLVVRDPRPWGLGRPGPGMRWIRYYDDAVMLDADDRVVTERGPVRWDAPRMAMLPPGHPPILPPGHPPVGPGWYAPPSPGMTSYRAGPGTTVTTRVEQVPPPMIYGGGYAGGYGGGTVVSVTPGTITTTTVTTERTSYRIVRPARRASPRGKLLRRY